MMMRIVDEKKAGCLIPCFLCLGAGHRVQGLGAGQGEPSHPTPRHPTPQAQRGHSSQGREQRDTGRAEKAHQAHANRCKPMQADASL